MTDADLMDAHCVHGNVWHECQECEWPAPPSPDPETVPVAAYERVRAERDKALRDLSAAKRRNRNLLDNLRAATADPTPQTDTDR